MFRARLRFQLQFDREWTTDTVLQSGFALAGGPWNLKKDANQSQHFGQQWLMSSGPMESHEEAMHAGRRAMAGLMRYSIACGLAVSFSARGHEGHITEYGRVYWARDGHSIVDDEMGLTVYEDTGKTQFLKGFSPIVSVASSAGDGLARWEQLAALSATPDTHTIVAFDLYSSSRFANFDSCSFPLVSYGD